MEIGVVIEGISDEMIRMQPWMQYAAALAQLDIHVEGIHYLVFDDPREISDIVADWTRPSRLDDLAEIAENGRRAALSYDGRGRIAEFFNRSVGEGTRTSAGPR